MSWKLTLTCRLCGATEHRVLDDDETAAHQCRATTVGEGLVTL